MADVSGSYIISDIGHRYLIIISHDKQQQKNTVIGEGISTYSMLFHLSLPFCPLAIAWPTQTQQFRPTKKKHSVLRKRARFLSSRKKTTFFREIPTNECKMTELSKINAMRNNEKIKTAKATITKIRITSLYGECVLKTGYGNESNIIHSIESAGIITCDCLLKLLLLLLLLLPMWNIWEERAASAYRQHAGKICKQRGKEEENCIDYHLYVTTCEWVTVERLISSRVDVFTFVIGIDHANICVCVFTIGWTCNKDGTITI